RRIKCRPPHGATGRSRRWREKPQSIQSYSYCYNLKLKMKLRVERQLGTKYPFVHTSTSCIRASLLENSPRVKQFIASDRSNVFVCRKDNMYPPWDLHVINHPLTVDPVETTPDRPPPI